jgi:hypothetical protein
MNRLNLTAIVLGLLTIAACKKNNVSEKNSAVETASTPGKSGAINCQPFMFSLTVDSVTGYSYVFKVTGSPSATPIAELPYAISSTNQLLTCNGTPIKNASGISFDPASGVFYGTTGANGSTPNAILKFTDPNCVTVTPAVASCGVPLDLSDIERDPTTGTYYAINRGVIAAANRIVRVNVPGPSVLCLASAIPLGVNMRGLAFDCSGNLYIMHMAGPNGTLFYVNKASGVIGTGYPYGVVTAPTPVAAPEMGLHFDCSCIHMFITSSFNPISLNIMTDGLPAGLGGPAYNAVKDMLHTTVDFANPY